MRVLRAIFGEGIRTGDHCEIGVGRMSCANEYRGSFALLFSGLMVLPKGGMKVKKRSFRRVVRQSAEAVSPTTDQIALSHDQLPPEAGSDEASPESFTCFRCGSPVSKSAERCPKCGIRYVSEYAPDYQGIEECTLFSVEDQVCLFESNNLTCMYFDVNSGTISCADFSGLIEGAVECQHCGILVEIPFEKCPICGHMLLRHSVELEEIVHDVEIGEELEDQINSEIVCPICGENSKLSNGRCVNCDTLLITLENDPKYRLRPILPTGSVLFVHLDVETGAISYLERERNKKRSGQVTINLGAIGTDGTDIDWKSIGRI